MNQIRGYILRSRQRVNAIDYLAAIKLCMSILCVPQCFITINNHPAQCMETGASSVSFDTTGLAHAVFQRDEDNKGFIPIQGNVDQVIHRIEARAQPRAGFSGIDTGWQNVIGKTISGKFAGTLEAAGGWYDLTIRAFDDRNRCMVETLVKQVGIGEVFITAGQSNSVNSGEVKTTPHDERVSALNLVKGQWQFAADPQPVEGQFPNAAGEKGSPWPALGDKLVKVLDVPIGFLSTGVGGSSIDDWSVSADFLAFHNDDSIPSLFHTNLKPAILALQKRGGFRAILFHQGESDSANGESTKEYSASLRKLIALSREDAGYRGPWVVAIASYYRYSNNPDGSGLSNDKAREKQITDAQLEVVGGDNTVFLGPKTDELGEEYRLLESYPPNFSQKAHFNAKGLKLHGHLWANALLENNIVPRKHARKNYVR